MEKHVKTGLRGKEATDAIMRWVQALLKDYPYEDLRDQHMRAFNDDTVVSTRVEGGNLRGLFVICRDLCAAVGLPDPKVFDRNPPKFRFRLKYFHDDNPSFIVVDLARADDGKVVADYYYCDGTLPQ